MTEREWRRGDKLDYKVTWLRHSHYSHSPESAYRKLRLFACGCCRRVWTQLSQRNRSAVELAERFVDGQALARELKARQRILQGNAHAVRAVHHVCATNQELVTAVKLVTDYARLVAAKAALKPGQTDLNPGCWVEEPYQAGLLREIVGNPFRPVALDPVWLRWNDATVSAWPQRIYDERRFADLPILADALEEAGCTNADILDHCRGPGPHVRGCWVVDLVLGKE